MLGAEAGIDHAASVFQVTHDSTFSKLAFEQGAVVAGNSHTGERGVFVAQHFQAAIEATAPMLMFRREIGGRLRQRECAQSGRFN